MKKICPICHHVGKDYSVLPVGYRPDGIRIFGYCCEECQNEVFAMLLKEHVPFTEVKNAECDVISYSRGKGVAKMAVGKKDSSYYLPVLFRSDAFPSKHITLDINIESFDYDGKEYVYGTGYLSDSE